MSTAKRMTIQKQKLIKRTINVCILFTLLTGLPRKYGS